MLTCTAIWNGLEHLNCDICCQITVTEVWMPVSCLVDPWVGDGQQPAYDGIVLQLSSQV